MKNKEYIIYIDKVKTSVIRVPAKNKKEAMSIANRFIEDLDESNININKFIHFNPEYKIKVRPSTQRSAFFIGGKKKWFLKL